MQENDLKKRKMFLYKYKYDNLQKQNILWKYFIKNVNVFIMRAWVPPEQQTSNMIVKNGVVLVAWVLISLSILHL